MKQIESIDDIRAAVRALRSENKTIAFVPTMGALHQGHISLIRKAHKHADAVVVSIYVNPEQFGPNEDFDSYPRRLQADLNVCEKEKVDLVFTPDDAVMYSSSVNYFSIEIEELGDHMDGASRPGFFEGIVLVVNKLFNIIKPDIAVFGQKDIQQFQILSRMVKEFNHSVELVMAPIARANDGLALSSRNAYLSEEERTIAPALYRALRYVEKQILDGVDKPELLLSHQKDELEAKGFQNDYLNVYSLDRLAPVSQLKEGNRYILAGAAYLGKTRLIDNIIIDF
ncbi:MAG: pantoate--beta-alanine ligase [Balneolaceae bacterium]|nr:pantoate--beta-alanine ligase [Balneolaceae bacterium]